MTVMTANSGRQSPTMLLPTRGTTTPSEAYGINARAVLDDKPEIACREDGRRHILHSANACLIMRKQDAADLGKAPPTRIIPAWNRPRDTL